MASPGAKWMGELLEVISTPVDAANIRDVAAKLEDINDDRPSDLNDRNAAIEKFRDKHAGSLKVCSFLDVMFKMKDKSRNSADEQYFMKARMFIYNILLHLTSSGDLGNDLARKLVVSDVCELIRRDVNDNRKTASEIRYRWKMVEKGLGVLINTASHAAKGRYRNDWLSTVTSYARHEDHILVFLAESLSGQLGVTGRFPKVSADVITNWTSWLGKCENEDGSYRFRLPEPSTTTYCINSLFDSFSRVVMKDDQKCALIQGLLPHCHHVENAITKGDEDDKRIITEVLKTLFTHNNCDICNLDFARDILVKSGKSVQEVVQLDPESTNIDDRFTWVAEHVYDKDTVCKLGSNLGLPLDTVKELITSNKDMLVASSMEVLRLWDERSGSSMPSARRRRKLLEALRVIKKGTNQEVKTLEPKQLPEQNNNEKPTAVIVTVAVTDAADHQVAVTDAADHVAEAPNTADDQHVKPETPPAPVKQESTEKHVQNEQKQEEAEDEMVPFPILHEIGRNIRAESMKTLAIECMDIPENFVYDTYKSKGEDANYEILVKWRNQVAGTKPMLKEVLRQGIEEKRININRDVFALLK